MAAATTMLTTTTGRQIEVRGGYEDIEATMAERQLSETGWRELQTAEGTRVKIARQAVAMIEEIKAAASAKHRLGFA